MKLSAHLTLSKSVLSSRQFYMYSIQVRDTFVTTDAPKFVLGAVLEQDSTDGRQSIAFLSKTLSSAEQNYAPNNSEILGIVYAIFCGDATYMGKSSLLRLIITC